MRNHAGMLALCTLGAIASMPAIVNAQEAPATAPVGETAAHHGRVGSGSGGGLGIGAAAFVSGLTGAQVVYDFGGWHAEGLFAFDHRVVNAAPMNPSQNTFDLGLSGWYHLHMGESSDFSIGGGLGFLIFDRSDRSSTNVIVFEPGVQIRAFVTPNVAVHARLGIPIIFGDNGVGLPNSTQNLSESYGIGGQLMSAFGFTYFFR